LLGNGVMTVAPFDRGRSAKPGGPGVSPGGFASVAHALKHHTEGGDHRIRRAKYVGTHRSSGTWPRSRGAGLPAPDASWTPIELSSTRAQSTPRGRAGHLIKHAERRYNSRILDAAISRLGRLADTDATATAHPRLRLDVRSISRCAVGTKGDQIRHE